METARHVAGYGTSQVGPLSAANVNAVLLVSAQPLPPNEVVSRAALVSLFAINCFAAEFPGERWATVSLAEAGLDGAKLRQARDYALTGGGSGYIVRGGKLVLSWGDPTQPYDLKSTTKSFGETASIPTKWISDDGRTIHLVFSDNDCFSVRKGTLLLR